MQIDAFLCDSVVSAEGKLYVHGAGWNTIWAQSFPARHPRVGIGIIIHVPYTATNQVHKLEVRVEDQDGNVIPIGDAPPGTDSPDGKIRKLGGEFNVGRPPVLPPGDQQVVALAIQIDGLTFTDPNMYSVVIDLDGSEAKRLPMRVALLAAPAPMVG